MSAVIDPKRYGISLSLKQCRNLGLDPGATLEWLLERGWRRVRLMTYWDEHEAEKGIFDFRALDTQLDRVARAGGIVTLCLGAKQPRWPEYHWPEWAWAASKPERGTALLNYIDTVVRRYRSRSVVTSWQLENEALLKGFGTRIEIDRRRLRAEFKLVKELDPSRPISMSTSNGWGLPFRRPMPDILGFSYYLLFFNKGGYRPTIQKSWVHRQRAVLAKVFLGRAAFIHELQCEPWGPNAIWEISSAEQDKSMSPYQLQYNISRARQIGIYPLDLWGAEWWYWRWLQGDRAIWQSVEVLVNEREL